MTWSTKKIGEVVEENKKSPFKVEDADNLGNFPFFTSGEAVLKHSHFLVDGENLFLSTGGSAYVKFYNGKSAYSTDTWCLKPKIVSSKFLYYTIFYSIKFIGARFFSGSGLKHLQKNEFLNFQIFFPPISVQQKIVLVLDTVRDAVEMQEKIIELTKELKNGLMAKLFSENSKFKILKWAKLGNYCEKPEYGYTSSATDKPVGPKFLRITDIQDDGVNWESVPFCECADDIKKKFILKKGNILVARIGATTGKTFLIRQEIPEAVFASYLICIRLKAEMLPAFLNYYFQSSGYWNQISQLKGGKLKGGISVPILQNLKVPVLSISQQREIVGILETIDQKIEVEQKKKALCEELFKTMLNKIMKQEIDVEKINL